MNTIIPASPLISIIMPAHNAEKFIAEAIESVLAQSYPHWELLIIDDDSSDKTAEIIQNYIKDSRIKYHKVQRIGHPAGVRNAALQLAQGGFVSFLDSDDSFYERTLENLLAPFLMNPNLNIVYGSRDDVDESGSLIKAKSTLYFSIPSHYLDKPLEYNHSWESVALGYMMCNLPAYMFRKSAIDEIGFLNEKLYAREDFEYIVRFCLQDQLSIHQIPDSVYRYRSNPHSLTKNIDKVFKVLDCNLGVLDWLYSHPRFPSELKRFSSAAYTEQYRIVARQWLLERKLGLFWKLILDSLKDKRVSFKDWFKYAFPLIIRSFIPHKLDQILVKIKAKFKK